MSEANETVAFTRAAKCSGCEDDIDPGENWGCAKLLIPIFGELGAVLIHRHYHVRCAPPQFKWFVLGDLGRERVDEN